MYLYCHLDTIAHSCSLMKAKTPKPVSHSLLCYEVIQDYNDLLLTVYESNSTKGVSQEPAEALIVLASMMVHI